MKTHIDLRNQTTPTHKPNMENDNTKISSMTSLGELHVLRIVAHALRIVAHALWITTDILWFNGAYVMFHECP